MSVSVRVDPDDPTPPYEQLRRQLATLITSGTLRAGTRLAPVRQLAADLALAAGTVARAYRELEAEGLVRTARGAGTRVAADAPQLSEESRRSRAADLATQYVASARRLGLDDAAVLGQVRDVLDS